jgi:hypothetical protein
MTTTVAALPSLDELRLHVLQTLCVRDCLDAGQTPLHEAVVLREGKPCGLFFHVQGPRQLRSYAVWAGQEHRLFFYDSSGNRYARRGCEHTIE